MTKVLLTYYMAKRLRERGLLIDGPYAEYQDERLQQIATELREHLLAIQLLDQEIIAKAETPA